VQDSTLRRWVCWRHASTTVPLSPVTGCVCSCSARAAPACLGLPAGAADHAAGC
jgi:hypothetical protein